MRWENTFSDTDMWELRLWEKWGDETSSKIILVRLSDIWSSLTSILFYFQIFDQVQLVFLFNFQRINQVRLVVYSTFTYFIKFTSILVWRKIVLKQQKQLFGPNEYKIYDNLLENFDLLGCTIIIDFIKNATKWVF